MESKIYTPAPCGTSPMKAWICIFRPCQWVHVSGGVWQCWRCKTISAGHILPGKGTGTYYPGCPQ